MWKPYVKRNVVRQVGDIGVHLSYYGSVPRNKKIVFQNFHVYIACED